MKTIKTKEPNKETLEAIKDSREDKNLLKYDNLKEMWDDSEEPKTFNCGFKALAWLRENPMREIEYEDDGLKHILRYGGTVFEYKRINYKRFDFLKDNPTMINDYWKNIKVLSKEKE